MKEEIRRLHKIASALQDVMKFTYLNDQNKVGQYSSFRSFAGKYNDIMVAAADLIDVSFLPGWDLSKLPHPNNLTWPAQKEYFDTILMNVGILGSILESHLDFKNSKTEELKAFLISNLRKAVFETPEAEKDIQDSVEKLLIGKGYSKGVDYGRETGRVKFSIKEFIPDFIFPKFSVALEVKFSRDNKAKAIVEEINADISAYKKDYANLIFLIYDLGTIRDEDEFKRDIEAIDSVHVIIVKQ